jgi:DNA-binding transcriptional regulator YiaG
VEFLRKLRRITLKNKYWDDFLGSLHKTAEGLHKIGVINDAEMRKYDRNCLAQED